MVDLLPHVAKDIVRDVSLLRTRAIWAVRVGCPVCPHPKTLGVLFLVAVSLLVGGLVDHINEFEYRRDCLRCELN